MKREIRRHKNCGGFILPDIENSFNGMMYGYCPKCNTYKLTMDDFDVMEENITLYVIMRNNEYLEVKYDDDTVNTIEFESVEQAKEFADKHNLSEYKIVPNVALYCDKAPVTNGKMIIEKE